MIITAILSRINNLIHNYIFQAIVLSVLASTLIVASVMIYLSLPIPI